MAPTLAHFWPYVESYGQTRKSKSAIFTDIARLYIGQNNIKTENKLECNATNKNGLHSFVFYSLPYSLVCKFIYTGKSILKVVGAYRCLKIWWAKKKTGEQYLDRFGEIQNYAKGIFFPIISKILEFFFFVTNHRNCQEKSKNRIIHYFLGLWRPWPQRLPKKVFLRKLPVPRKFGLKFLSKKLLNTQ